MIRSARSPLVVAVSVAMTAILISPVAAADDEPDPVLVPLDAAGSVLAVADEYLVDLSEVDEASLSDLEVDRLGFGWALITDRSGADPLVRASQLSTRLDTKVVPNLLSSLEAVNPEPFAGDQWALENTGQFGGTVDADVDGVEAWDVTTGEGAVVAVLDTGADLDHPDLSPSFWVNPGEIPDNGLDDDANGYVDDVNGWDFVTGDNSPQDEPNLPGTGHGSAVAGIVAAPINGIGIAGVAPGARLMVLRVCGGAGCADGDVIEALAYAAANGADVANLSFGRVSTFPAPLEAGVQGAIDGGVTVLVAAGNGGNDGIGDDNDTLGQYPANFTMTGMLSVTATDHDDVLADFGNYGAGTVDLGAPGVSIESTTEGGGWDTWSGTSFSAPLASGVAALIASNDACAGPGAIEARVRDRGDAVPSLDGFTISGRRLNALRSLTTTAIADEVVAAGAPMAVRFGGGEAGTVWDLGDGDTATGGTVEHVYGTGVYDVTNDNSGSVWTVAAGIQFSDTCGHFFHDEIVWLSALGVTTGCATGEYCPNDELTRAQMATFLARALNLPAASTDHFTDDGGSVHEPNINALAEAGIAAGCDVGLFCPSDELTRAQMASLVARAFGLSGGTDAFGDDGGSVHEPNINALASTGITSGCAEGLFCPSDPITRGQMAAFLYRGRAYLP